MSNFDLATGFISRAVPVYFDLFRERLSASAVVNHFVSGRGGDHQLKIGGEYQIAGDNNVETRVGDALTFTFNGVPSFVSLFNTPIVGSQHRFNEINLYGQDSWTPHDRLTINLGARFSAVRGFTPAQGSPAGTFSPARSFARQDLIAWNSLAPRVGAVYDITGEGTRALKVSYGRYYHPLHPFFMGPVNQHSRVSQFHLWNDDGDGLFQVGEEGLLLSRSGGTTLTGGTGTDLDPDLKQPRTDEVTAGFEAELPQRIGLSVNFVYRKKSDLIALTNTGVPDSAYVAVDAVDPGRDGQLGTADDGTITVFNQRPQSLGADRLLETNPPGFDGEFKGLELVAQKRLADGWQLLASYAVGKSTLARTAVETSAFGSGEELGAGGFGEAEGPQAYTNPNSAINQGGEPDFYDRTHIVKILGSYEVPRIGVNVAAVFKAQTGFPYGRVLTLTQDAAGNPFNQGTVTVFAEPRDTFRLPTVRYLDFQISKPFEVGAQRFDLVLDVFNVTNSNVVTNLNANTGPAFQSPTDVLGPRVFRLGGRWRF